MYLTGQAVNTTLEDRVMEGVQNKSLIQPGRHKKEKCLKSIRHTVKIEKPLRNPRNRIAIYSIGLFNYTLFQVKNP